MILEILIALFLFFVIGPLLFGALCGIVSALFGMFESKQ